MEHDSDYVCEYAQCAKHAYRVRDKKRTLVIDTFTFIVASCFVSICILCRTCVKTLNRTGQNVVCYDMGIK